MEYTLIIPMAAAAFGALSYMAFNHPKLFVPYVSGMLAAAVPFWGIIAGAKMTLFIVSYKFASNEYAALRNELHEWGNYLPVSFVWFCLCGLWMLKHFSEHIETIKQNSDK